VSTTPRVSDHGSLPVVFENLRRRHYDAHLTAEKSRMTRRKAMAAHDTAGIET
jgi:hypothetical protein